MELKELINKYPNIDYEFWSDIIEYNLNEVNKAKKAYTEAINTFINEGNPTASLVELKEEIAFLTNENTELIDEIEILYVDLDNKREQTEQLKEELSDINKVLKTKILENDFLSEYVILLTEEIKVLRELLENIK